jgi:hypothetical protein
MRDQQQLFTSDPKFMELTSMIDEVKARVEASLAPPPKPTDKELIAQLWNAIARAASTTGQLIQTFVYLRDLVWPAPPNLHYHRPEDDDSRSRRAPVPMPPGHAPYWSAFDMYHRSERWWRNSLTRAERAVDRAAHLIDGRVEDPFACRSVLLRQIIQDLHRSVPAPIAYGVEPPIDHYDSAALLDGWKQIGAWCDKIRVLCPVDSPGEPARSGSAWAEAAAPGRATPSILPQGEELKPSGSDAVELLPVQVQPVPRSNAPALDRARALFEQVAELARGALVSGPTIYNVLGKDASYLRNHMNKPGYWDPGKLDQVPGTPVGKVAHYSRESVLRRLCAWVPENEARLCELGAMPAERPAWRRSADSA